MAGLFFKKDRKKSPYIVTYDEPTHGPRKTKQKSFATEQDAKLFKAQIELEILQWKQDNPVPREQLLFVSGENLTVEEYVTAWLPKYGKKRWEASTYNTNEFSIKNHILPILGHKQLGEVTKRDIEMFISHLENKNVSGDRAKNKEEHQIESLSSATIRKIFFIVKKIFDTAYMDHVLEKNIFNRIEAPVAKNKKRAVWTPAMVRKALDNITDPLLHLFVHLTFMCTGRNGEAVGLTWDCVYLDEEQPYIYVDKTLQRLSEDAVKETGSDELIYIFPKKVDTSTSVMALKKTKTTKSERKIFLTQFLTDELRIRRNVVKMQKELLEIEYMDYNLVFTLGNGDPVEPKRMLRWFQKWQAKNPKLNLPLVDIHSLRHTGAKFTYQATQNDIRSVQLRTGHSNERMAHGYS